MNRSNIWKESVVLEVQKYIQNNYTRHLRLGDISQAMCISTNYLNTMFKSLTGKTIMQYTEDIRLDRAKYLLLQTNMSVNNISMELGYYDQYHFSNIFKKAIGVSPTQFRKSQLNFTSK
jgi:AraC-like DNA-binding protein